MQMIWTDFTDKLTELYAGKQSPWGVLQRVIRVMLNLFRHLKKGFGNLFKGAPPAPEKMSPAGVCKKPTKGPQTSAGILEALGKGWETIRPVVLGATIEHWLVKRFKEMARRFKIIGEVFGTLPPSTSKKPPGFFKKKITPLLPPLPLELQKLPAFPTVPPFPSLEDIYKRTLASGAGKPPDVAVDLGKAFVLDKDAERALERLRHPPEVFAGERLALKAKQAEARKKPQDVLAESQLKTLVFGIIDRFLPEAIAAEVPRLQVLLWQLEEAKQAAGEKAAFPVRQLLEGDRLALEVLRLRIHAPGMNKGEVQRWAEDVSLALTSQPYRTLARVEAR
jgi:hypothetical protein